MDDLVTLVVLASSAFLVVLEFGLLTKYKQVSEKITTSTDLGKDLWGTLERRLRKQDERILDLMGRVEVIQARVTTRVDFPRSAVHDSAPVTLKAEVVTAAESRDISPIPMRTFVLDDTEKTVMRLLREKPRNSVEVKDLLQISREHAARLMKSLFDRNLVTRDDSSKPFVYVLSDAGQRYLSQN